MSDIKNLIKAKSHDPYREFEIVSYLTCFETAHKEFFKFMAEKGYELYKKKSGECSKSGNKGISDTPGNGTETGRKDDNAPKTDGGNESRICNAG